MSALSMAELKHDEHALLAPDEILRRTIQGRVPGSKVIIIEKRSGHYWWAFVQVDAQSAPQWVRVNDFLKTNA